MAAEAVKSKKAYKLGAVKPHVAAAADEVGGKFSLRTIYGWSARGSVTSSDHPKGLALDYMISNMPNGRSIGDAIADYLISNADRLGITYIIWYRRIWSVARKGEGWRPYNGPRSHTDHVHASFKPGGGTGGGPIDVPTGGGETVETGAVPVGFGMDTALALVKVNAAFGRLTDPKLWQRMGLYALGAGLVLAGLVLMFRKPLGAAVGTATDLIPETRVLKTVGKVAK